jgi:uncharacterized protein
MIDKVYYIKAYENDNEDILINKLKKLILDNNLFEFISRNDFTAIKSHFGESKSPGFVKPVFLKLFGDIVKEMDALPFLTETSTLYKGNRSDAVTHTSHAIEQGFTYDNTGLPIIMADGLLGDEEIEVDINGKFYDKINVASQIVKAQSMILVSHFTGHIVAGFGAALKNLGMGCVSKKGKMEQHSTSKPKVKKKNCTKCGLCIEWCPVDAITMNEESAKINKEICIGCGQCLTVCRFDAVAHNWKAANEDLQKKIVEHAWGVFNSKKDKLICINFLINISKDCDCMTNYSKMSPDIGILISKNPVAIDAASIDLIEKANGKSISELSYDIPYKVQIDYAEEIGFADSAYKLVIVD